MTSIERTAYPRFRRTPSIKELRDLYTPTLADKDFVNKTARGPAQKFGLMILLKVYQRLGYFPKPETIPGAIIGHIRMAMKFDDTLVPDIASNHTLYRYHKAIREKLEIQGEGKHIRHVAAQAMHKAAQVMENPADLISAATQMLVKEHCELPAFSTIERMARRIRALVNRGIYQTIQTRLDSNEQQALFALLEQENEASLLTPFNRIKETPKSATLTHLDEWLSRLTWLESLGNMQRLVEGVPYTKVKHLAEEARSLHATNLKDFPIPKRLALLVCLIHQATVSTRDEIVIMFLKRMSVLTNKAKEELERLKAEERTTAEHLIEVFSDVLHVTTEQEDPATADQQIRELLEREGGAAHLLEQCERISSHHGDRYQPLVWQFYSHHRKVLFQVIKTLDLQSTTSDQTLVDAMNFLIAHEGDKGKYVEASLDLSFASQKWLRTVSTQHKGKDCYVRRHLETCVFSYIAAELKTGDLCATGSEQFADYRSQLLSWEECEPKVAEYCQRLNLSPTAEGFVKHLRTRLTETATSVDRTRPENHYLEIDEKGEPSLKRIKAKAAPRGMKQLEEALQAKIPERHLLDILARIDCITNFTHHFGPLSGNDPKTIDATVRQLLTIFAYGTHLGPHQMARHLRGLLDADQIAHINHRHITAEKLEAAIRDIVNCFHRFKLPHYWGDEKRVGADGTQYDLPEENLIAEKHIRYGGYGGIAYHHISDTYILLMSQFVICGAWEAIYILDGLIRNKSNIKPKTIHADTQGQNLPVFGLSSLLGVELMPRIRNWKDLKFYRPARDTTYQHIDTLFGDNVVDWELIKMHWQDLLRVVISIQEGKILPSMLLRKLSTYSRKNRLYQAFHALGTVERTIFLLKYISDVKLREVIHRTTNKVEQYNNFEDWITFALRGGMTDNVYVEQEKRIKYTDLIANCVMLDNTLEISASLNTLAKEGRVPTVDQLAALSPYQTRHIKRFGDYELDLSAIAEPVMDDLTFEIEPPEHLTTVEAGTPALPAIGTSPQHVGHHAFP
jgi:TnpA family transposase